MRQPQQTGGGVTLIELVLVMVVSGILFVVSPPLLSQGVKTLVFLPRALAANDVAREVMHQLVEGGFSTLPGQTTIRGLRFAVKRSAAEPALWLAANDQIGFRTSDGQSVLIRWNQTVNQEAMRRSLLTPVCPLPAVISPEEVLPYEAREPQSNVRILQIDAVTPVFRYYNQSGTLVAAPGCSLSGITTIRRVDITFTAQTGSGLFDEGQTTEGVTTSVAIRVP